MERCKDCSVPLPQTWSGPLRHCPACGSLVKVPETVVKMSIGDVKVTKKPAAKKTTKKKAKK